MARKTPKSPMMNPLPDLLPPPKAPSQNGGYEQEREESGINPESPVAPSYTDDDFIGDEEPFTLKSEVVPPPCTCFHDQLMAAAKRTKSKVDRDALLAGARIASDNCDRGHDGTRGVR